MSLYSAHPDRIPMRPVSIAPTTTTSVTDENIGLPVDHVAQRRAEAFIRASLSYRLKQAERAEIEATRTVRLALSRILVRLPEPADDIENVEAIPDSAELVPRERFQ